MILVLVVSESVCLADGKVFVRENVNASIPYQRAIILFKNGKETLILQSKYRMRDAGEGPVLGWVVPVPGVPELASMPASSASRVFKWFNSNTQPRVRSISQVVFGSLSLGLGITSMAILLLCLVSGYFPVLQKMRQRRGHYFVHAALLLLLSILLFGIVPSSLLGSRRVDVISERQVGIYDVKVVSSETSAELVSWLSEHGFRYGPEDRAAFDMYISRKWCFAVACINPSKEARKGEIESEGLAAPLILRFRHDNPVYPLALTGTAGEETEILIYLASDEKMSCRKAIELKYAKIDPVPADLFTHHLKEVEPANFFRMDDFELKFIHKFKETLSAERMRSDLEFSPAEDDEEFVTTIWRW